MKWTILMLVALLLVGCGAPGSPAGTPAPAETEAPAALWTREDSPAAVRYDRLWIYSAVGRSEDPETIGALVAAIRALTVGPVSDSCTEDYTDILTFTFADGGTLRLEFEGQNVVLDDGTRREVQGLARLREILNGLVAAEELPTP